MRNTFDEAIGASPASTVDVDAVVAIGRRRARLRRLTTVGAGVGTLAVVGTVGTLVLASWVSAAPDPGPNQVQPAAPDGSAPVRDGETPEQTEQRLVSALTDGLTAALPGVQLSDGPTGQPGVELYHDPGTGRYDSDAVITTAAGEGEIFFVSWAGGDLPDSTPPAGETAGQPAPPVAVTWVESCADMPEQRGACTEFVGPDGQTVVVVTERLSEGAQAETAGGGPDAGPVEGTTGQMTTYQVYVTWTNAKVVLAIASDTKRGTPDTIAQLPLLTTEQITTIAMSPELTVTA